MEKGTRPRQRGGLRPGSASPRESVTPNRGGVLAFLRFGKTEAMREREMASRRRRRSLCLLLCGARTGGAWCGCERWSGAGCCFVDKKEEMRGAGLEKRSREAALMVL
uniref:Uncharacterized protein n=1 Tax=Arundo donax TaxID=35708 RepID=A0A0A8ZW14_ARUDO